MQKCLFRIIQSLETMCKKTFDYRKTFRVRHAAGNEGNSHLSGTCLQNERTELSGKQFMSTGSKMDSICSDCLKSLFDSSPGSEYHAMAEMAGCILRQAVESCRTLYGHTESMSDILPVSGR